MKSLVAALGAFSLLAFASAPASAAPTVLHMSVVADHVDRPADSSGAITFTNPLGRSRGPGTGYGQL